MICEAVRSYFDDCLTIWYFWGYMSIRQFSLTLIRLTFLSSRNKLENLQCKSFDWSLYDCNIGLNPLSANPTKRSNTLKQFVDCCRRIVWVCLTILWGWHLRVNLQLMRNQFMLIDKITKKFRSSIFLPISIPLTL